MKILLRSNALISVSHTKSPSLLTRSFVFAEKICNFKWAIFFHNHVSQNVSKSFFDVHVLRHIPPLDQSINFKTSSMPNSLRELSSEVHQTIA